jgi:CDP-diacylglycerol--glycerol-3-phosphate 3-phosphatidyltransferase
VFPLPWALPVAMWLLAAASMITCAQRLHTVRHSAGAADPMVPNGEQGQAQPRKGEP